MTDNNHDGKHDVVMADTYDSYVVRYVDGRRIFNRYRQQDVIDITAYDEDSIEIVNILNEPLHSEYIKKDDIINVPSDIYGNVRRIVVTIDSCIGTLDKIYSGEENGTFLTIDGIEYKASADFAADFDISGLMNI